MKDERSLVYLAGSAWDGVIGTDRRLVSALAASVPVLWVDPPVSQVVVRRESESGSSAPIGVSDVGPNIRRLRVLGPPGITRPGARSIAAAAVSSRIKTEIGSAAAAVVVATPEGRFPRVSGKRVYYITDDWSAGAAMMGLGRRRISRLQRLNSSAADVVAAVSEQLLCNVRSMHRSSTRELLLANGCDPIPAAQGTPGDLPTGRFAILMGQINERIDLTMLRAVADRGVPLLVVGPRTDRDAETGRRLDEILGLPTVHWVGRRAPGELPGYLAAAAVGLTPYVDDAFNRASFPLKTLEYLAAGLPVVATDLPAVRWLDTPLIDVAGDVAGFADSVERLVSGPSSEDAAERREFAARHSWESRAEQLLSVVEIAG